MNMLFYNEQWGSKHAITRVLFKILLRNKLHLSLSSRRQILNLFTRLGRSFHVCMKVYTYFSFINNLKLQFDIYERRKSCFINLKNKIWKHSFQVCFHA